METVCFDFDGVIHSYKSGWKGIDVIPDPPVDGIREVMQELKDDGYNLVIHSTRAVEVAGKYYPPLCEPDDANERWRYCLACSCLNCPYMKDRRPQ